MIVIYHLNIMDDELFMYTTSFNSVLKRMIKFACSKSLALKTHRVQARVALLINEAPLTVLQTAGPYIITYADHIKARNEEFFLNADFSKHYSNEAHGDQKDVINLIDQVRKIYKKCDDKERALLNDLTDDLLIAYCMYVKRERECCNNKK